MLHPVSTFQLRVGILQEYGLACIKRAAQNGRSHRKTYGESLQVALAAIFTIGTRSPHDELYLVCVESTLCLQALDLGQSQGW